MPTPENFEIIGAIWCVLRPPESFLDQRKSICFSIKMEMNSFTFVYFNAEEAVNSHISCVIRIWKNKLWLRTCMKSEYFDLYALP